jgi:hypothetical protein
VLIAAVGEITVVTICGKRRIRSPEMVITSFEPATTAIIGRKVIVTMTPVSEANCFDKVICEQKRDE